MNFPRRRKKQNLLPGRTFVVRAHRQLPVLTARVRPGDLVVIDELDLDGDRARALAARKPAAVLNAADYISGRYPNRGPSVLLDAGVRLYRGRRDLVLALRDEHEVRLDGSTLYDGAVVLLDVEELTADQVGDQLERARSGLAAQLESFAHSASEFVHREEAVLLHGDGLPELSTRVAGRVVVVVGPGAQPGDLSGLRRFLRDTRPVLIGVDAGIDLIAARGLRPDIAVLSGTPAVSDKALRGCREAVLCGLGRAAAGQVEKLNLPAHTVSTGAAPVDLALLIARSSGARLVVPVGAPATLEEFVDRDRNEQASNVLTRLRLGSTVVDGGAASTVLATRRRRFGVALGILVALAVVTGVLAFTPSGHDWRHDLADRLPAGWGNTGALDREKARVRARDERITRLQAGAKADGGYIDATAAGIVRGRLAGRAVALVLLPGAEADRVTALKSLLAVAGARLTAEVTVLPAVAKESEAGLVSALTSQMLTQATDVHLPAGSDGAQRLGALLARAVAVPASAHLAQAPYDARAVGIVSGLQAAGLVSAKVSARAGLTLVVAGSGGTGTDTLASLAGGLSLQVPSVVAGDTGGALAALRTALGKVVSTVDGTGTAAGRVAVVLALAARAGGLVGSFGRTGSSGPVPPV
jgi:uncharacterized membrane-anchored protein